MAWQACVSISLVPSIIREDAPELSTPGVMPTRPPSSRTRLSPLRKASSASLTALRPKSDWRAGQPSGGVRFAQPERAASRISADEARHRIGEDCQPIPTSAIGSSAPASRRRPWREKDLGLDVAPLSPASSRKRRVRNRPMRRVERSSVRRARWSGDQHPGGVRSHVVVKSGSFTTSPVCRSL
jgi:hypothetical protein